MRSRSHRPPRPDLSVWQDVPTAMYNPEGEVNVAIVGKYTQLEDAYKSINEALTHGGMANRVKVKVEWVDAEVLTREDVAPHLEGFHAILVPGALANAAPKARSKRRNLPANASPLSWASVWACKWP